MFTLKKKNEKWIFLVIFILYNITIFDYKQINYTNKLFTNKLFIFNNQRNSSFIFNFFTISNFICFSI